MALQGGGGPATSPNLNLNPPAGGGSVSGGWSESTSTPVAYEGPQTGFLMEVAQYARNLAPQMLEWAQGAYARGEALSDDLLNQANIYASPGRIAQDMGQAQAHVQQGAEAARQASIRDLEKYGIDPSSGRYAALDMAERNKAAAAAAGAGNVQRNATEATGRELRRDAFAARNANNQFGATAMRIPNDYLNTAMSLKYPPMGQQSNSRSQQQSASAPPVSAPAARSQQPKKDDARRQPGSGAVSPGGGPGGGSRGGVSPGGGDRGYGGLSRTAGGGRGGGAGILHLQDYAQQYSDYGYYDPMSYAQNSYDLPYNDRYYSPYSAYDPGGSTWGTQDYTDPFGGWDQQYQNGGDWQQGTQWDGDWGPNPMDSYDFNTGGDDSSWWDGGQQGDWTDSSGGYDDYSSWNGDWGDGWGDSQIDYGSYDDGGYDSYDWGSYYDDSGWGDSQIDYGSYDDGGYDSYDWGSYYDSGSGSYDDSGWGDSAIDYGSYDDGGYDSYDWGSYDSGGYDDYSYDDGGYDSYDWGGDYAAGGEVATQGGFVSPELSPSAGAEVDDVQANLNAGEFVIPKDVAYWKGAEFFQKLIQKSRQARAGAPARPTPSMG